MRRLFILSLMSLLIPLIQSCGSLKNNSGKDKPKPQWVNQRPVNTAYYVGIGYASKLSNPGDYLQVAKKNALNDMTGEIKVTVSTNSILSQYQSNSNFSQQFFSDTRMIASETMEGFQVVDSWENKTDYWIYYRMNKEDYEAYKRRKLQQAVERALDMMYRADKMDTRSEFIQAFRLRLKAAINLQNYLNESVETEYNGKQVFLVNEILSQLQDQLYMLVINPVRNTLSATIGKAFDQPVQIKVSYKSKDSSNLPVGFIPLRLFTGSNKVQGSTYAESQTDGSAEFGITRVLGKDPVQIWQVKADLEKMIRIDSLNTSMRNLLLNLEGPMAGIRVKVDPIKMYFVSQELNLGQKLPSTILEPALKRKLTEDGCVFVSDMQQADYMLTIESNTKDEGVMWRTMLQSTAGYELIVKNARNGEEIMRDAVSGIQGFQTTPEKAGLEAYKNLTSTLLSRTWPELEKNLFFRD